MAQPAYAEAVDDEWDIEDLEGRRCPRDDPETDSVNRRSGDLLGIVARRALSIPGTGRIVTARCTGEHPRTYEHCLIALAQL
ncbi:hypothetical protein NFJ02_14g17190 [Pycnococcus provasolii]